MSLMFGARYNAIQSISSAGKDFTIFIVSKLDNSKQAQLERLLYPAQKVRSETGLGAAAASSH